MLNTFPELLSYSPLAPFILRVVLGLIFLDLGILKFRGEKARWIASFEALRLPRPSMLVSIVGGIEILGSIMLILGMYTQIAALVFVILVGKEIFIEYKASLLLKRNIVFYVLLFAIAFSLLLTGAGAFAFDIPL